MNRGTKPDVVIYHSPCFDGFGAAWAIHQNWRTGVEYVPAKYGDAPPPGIEGKGVLVADFSYPAPVLREMATKAAWVHVLDHHEGMREELLELRETREALEIEVTFDLERSGAILAWQYAWGPALAPRMLAHVGDRDLWKFEIEGTREVMALLSLEPQDFEAWTAFARRLEDPGERVKMFAEGASVLRSRSKDLADLLKATTREVAVDGEKVLCANVPYFWASEAGDILGADRPFAITYFDAEDGTRRFSLRSRTGTDVASIAKKFGGGGHKAAAGFTLPITQETWPGAPIKLNAGRGNVQQVS